MACSERAEILFWSSGATGGRRKAQVVSLDKNTGARRGALLLHPSVDPRKHGRILHAPFELRDPVGVAVGDLTVVRRDKEKSRN